MHHAAASTATETDSPPAISRQVARAQRREARSLFWRGWTLVQIAEEMGVKYSTLASWSRRDGWELASPIAVIDDRIEVKIAALLDKEPFTEGDMKRVDFLMRQLEKSARIRKYGETGKEGDLNERIAARNGPAAKAKREEKRRNFLTLDQWQALLDDFHAKNFAYQELWWEHRNERTRKLRKSRQVGATWYFAREALAKVAEAVLEGQGATALDEDERPRNQIFLSASERQALKFRREIVGWVRRVTGVELKGKIIMLDFVGQYPDEEGEGGEPAATGPALDPVGFYFLSTNSATAQGESGDFYFDEYAWVPNFSELNGVASAMATHKIYKKTYFSSPSIKTHASYAFWNGEDWNKGRAKGEQKPFDISLKNLRGGARMPDGSWQQSLTIHDAVAGGLGKLVDVDELRREYSEERFRNLFECEDIDDTESSFPYARISPARVNSFLKWSDFRPALIDIPGGRPFGDAPVWIGYDPNKQGRDDAALVVLAPPEDAGRGKFRVLEKHRLNGLDFQGQADFIKAVATRYNVTDIAIDTTGHGQAVFELVSHWFPMVRKIEYSVASKTALVIKGQNVFRAQRIEFDAGWSDLMAALMAIRPALTGSQKGVTYIARRNGEVGHADIAWALLNALSNEPLDAGTAHEGARGGRAIFFD
ncbi:terminase large subunit domain-containing protein [Novosphingobium colocasiae]|uniref:Phage terminase ATPase subunit n=1 Tax=Novosphingobium colocasiae TaxID=1256513 RepID=A0A918PFE9_9SPHN|nr:terminase family protein [Novosphingobium colocasiae]GGZ02790.1 phage terminase ATPase subunit [Novosphingobium colocasiae]